MLTFYAFFYILHLTKVGDLKRKDILKRLEDAGFTFKEGGSHTKAYDQQGRFRTTIGRHTEIAEIIVKAIEKQTGINLH